MATSALSTTLPLPVNAINTAPVSIQPQFLLGLRRNLRSAQTASLADGAPPATAGTSPQISPVAYSPAHVIRRRVLSIPGITAELVQGVTNERLESRVRASGPTLIAYERGARRDGLTTVDGMPPSSIKDMTRKFTFLPAGAELREWHIPRVDLSIIYFHFDPDLLPKRPAGEPDATPLSPRLFFEDATLWDTVLKMKAMLENPSNDGNLYFEALGLVLAHEVSRPRNSPTATNRPLARGGLAPWQQRAVIAYIDEHLSEPISLATLAGIVRLSPYYFCRAFKQSLGVPPHKYHTNRRIEVAKELLSKHDQSVTDIGLALGFSETSSFSAAFRKITGRSPTGYQRSAG